MYLVKSLLVLTLVVFSFSMAHAEQDKKASYALKKHGLVYFEDKKTEATETTNATSKSVSEIEPAAGAVQSDTLRDMMRLPRKN